MREAESFPWRAAAEEQRAHARRLAYAGCGDRRIYIGHCVVDCQTGGYTATWSVYVEGYRAVWCVGFKEEELGDYGGGDGFVYGTIEADYSFLTGVSSVRTVMSLVKALFHH